jgi:hypothetical protein
LIVRTGAITNGSSASGSGACSASIASWLRIGVLILAPASGNATSIPIAGSVIRMSENRIAASNPNSSIGWSVTSQASSGLRHRSRNEARACTARYAGR